MKRKVKRGEGSNLSFLLMIIFLVSFFMNSFKVIYAQQSDYDTKFNERKGIYRTNRDWRIKFSEELNKNSLSKIYISYDKEGKNRVEGVSINLDEEKKNEVIVCAPEDGYRSGEYYLFVENNIQAKNKRVKTLDKPIRMQFTIENREIKVAESKKKNINISNITDNMKKSSFWINKLENPKELIMNKEEIMDYNKEVIDSVHTVHYLETYPTTVEGNNLKTYIETYNIPNYTPYDEYGKIHDMVFFNTILDNRNLNDIGKENTVKYGLTISRSEMRSVPTEEEIHINKNDTFDMLQETAVEACEPVVILHESLDKQWYFVQAYNYMGWIKKGNIAESSKEDIFKFVSQEDFVVVLEDFIKLNFDNREFKYFMGTKIPIGNKIGDDIRLKVPTRKQDGTLEIREVFLENGAEVSQGYLPYTRENILKQIFKLYGTYYEWGDKNNGRDCSSTMLSVYKVFGIRLPRNTDEQEISPGKVIRFNYEDSTSGRYALLENLKVGNLIFMNGHVVMYIGEDNGKHYIIHNFAGIKDGVNKEVLSVAVTTADMRTFSGASYIDLYTTALNIE